MNAPEPLAAEASLVADADPAAPPSNAAAGAAAPLREWLIVTQYKSDRIVYFTDDLDFALPADADWCYVSPFAGALPAAMSLRNCWGWRYRGDAFIDARQAPTKPRAEALLDNNKEALRRLLREKIDAWRKPLASSSALGTQARAAKLEEAKEVLDGGADEEILHVLPVAAASRGLSLFAMAQLIVDKEAMLRDVLRQSEAVREELAAAIERATTQDELGALRERLLNELTPAHRVDDPLRPAHTTTEQLRRQPRSVELEQERLRLRVKLRLKVNELRRPFVSHYLLDDEVLRHKADIAERVLAIGGAIPPGAEASALISHAASRGQSLYDGAQDVITEKRERGATLLETEKLKDALLSRISAVTTFAEIAAVDRLIEGVRMAAAVGLAAGAAKQKTAADAPGKPAR